MKKNFKFEEKIIDPILNLIKNNQEYLTKEENLPQLAKLGYMYNTLWYAGSVAWGCDGILWTDENKFDDVNPDFPDEIGYYCACENNPKYKIEMCEPETEKADLLIYDCWGMHVSNDLNIGWVEFKTIVLDGKKLTELQKKLLKVDKTFEDWVNVLTDKEYQYASIYPDEKSVANHLLACIGNGYGYEEGFVFAKASGADVNIARYGDWKNVTLRNDINDVVLEIMNNPNVKLTITGSYDYVKSLRDKRNAENVRQIRSFGKTYKKLDEKDLVDKAEKYHHYYPISNYSIITMFNEESDISYVKAAINICENILRYSKDEYKSNVKFANKNIDRFKELYIKKKTNEIQIIKKKKNSICT